LSIATVDGVGLVSEVHDERVEVVCQAAGGGGESLLVELLDQPVEAVFGVGL
jgi:hypothetical protein